MPTEEANDCLCAAVLGIYEAFSKASRPAYIDGCSCCLQRAKIDVLLSKPREDLTPDDLTHYAASVFLTVGTESDFFYFLPRILEIAVHEPGWWPSVEVIAAAIHNSGFHAWPQHRRSALHQFFEAAFSHALEEQQHGKVTRLPSLDSWVCAFGRLHLDLAPYLHRILGNPSKLIEYYEENSGSLIRGRLANSFWELAPQEAEQVLQWFASSAVTVTISRAYGL